MIDVAIEIPETGATATHAEIINNHTDVPNMHMTICVGLFNDAMDRLKIISIEKQLTSFPIPSIDEQWQIVMPALDGMPKPGSS